MYLIFDTETTGLPKKWNAPISDSENWPRCVQLAWQLHDNNGKLISHQSSIIKPDGFDIPFESEKVHGISTVLANEIGENLNNVLEKFNSDLSKAKYIVGHNLKFDINIVGAEFFRLKIDNSLNKKNILDTCTEKTANLCQIQGGRGKFKFPTLIELYKYLFNDDFQQAHNASADVEATSRSFFELIRINNFNVNDFEDFNEIFNKLNLDTKDKVGLFGIKHLNLKEESKKIKKETKEEAVTEIINKSDKTTGLENHFVHLHNNSQFSVLQSTSKIADLVKKTSEMGMSAVALTDKANMMGCFHFYRAIKNFNENNEEGKKIKPIIGCELNVCENHIDKSSRDDGYQIVFLAKNKIGYQNLIKMCSIGYTEGFYYVPRVDREIVLKYSEGLIVLSGNKYGEISNKILNVGENQAIEALEWWKSKFNDDFYLELIRHGEEEDEVLNNQLLKFSKTYDVKLIATNNTHYINKEDANAHDILLCVKDGEKQSTPIGKGRNFRYGLKNQEYYFKSPSDMVQLFQDIPINFKYFEIVDKVDEFELQREVLLPKFDIPEDFQNDSDDLENDYLKHLTLEGAKFHYKDLTNDLLERIDFELQVIKNSGYPGYFLIVQDLIKAARKMGVSVGPGRGSVAGSVVAYCLV